MQLSWQNGHVACDALGLCLESQPPEVEAEGCSEFEAALAWKSHHLPDLQIYCFQPRK